VGDKGTKGIYGEPLKLGHIPTAVNIPYSEAWEDEQSKYVKTYRSLQETYQGLDPEKGVIVYCNSGRRSSFTYFILSLMGFPDVRTYDGSWKEWGNPNNFYPVETMENILTGGHLLEPPYSKPASAGTMKTGNDLGRSDAGKPKGGYISCGG
jgi:thiosulfate/3-mercaptopyruvate sulfurtransferase